MLYLENEEVKITDEGMLLPEIKELYSRDKRNESKPFFKKCLVYMYWGYKKEGEWSNHLPKKRLEMAAKMAEVSVSDMEDHPAIKKAIKAYVDNQTTLTERLYLGVKKDIEDILELIQGIPFEKEIKVELMIDVPEYEGSNKLIKVPIKQMVKMDNSAEKAKALSRVEQLIDLEERLRKKIIKENLEKRGRGERLFDRR